MDSKLKLRIKELAGETAKTAAPRLSFGEQMVADLLEGARRAGGAIEMGDHGHESKLAGVMDAVKGLGMNAHDAIELGGLGLIAAPVAHNLLSGGKAEENHTVKKVHEASDLAGLGLLASPYIMKMLKRG